MSRSIKAAFLSFLFPGLGEIYLRRFWRGIMIMIFVLAGIGVITVITMVRVSEDLKRIQAGGSAVDTAAIDHIVSAVLSGPSFHMKIIFLIVLGMWLYSIIDAYRLGRKTESVNEKV